MSNARDLAAFLRGETVSPSEASGTTEADPDHGGRISRPYDPYQGWGAGPNGSHDVNAIRRMADPAEYDFAEMMNNFNRTRGSRRGNPWSTL